MIEGSCECSRSKLGRPNDWEYFKSDENNQAKGAWRAMNISMDKMETQTNQKTCNCMIVKVFQTKDWGQI